MKKLILLALTALIIVGCNYKNQSDSFDTSRRPCYETIVIDSCEYINRYNKLVHKGNCRFCKKRRQKELKELVKQLNEK